MASLESDERNIIDGQELNWRVVAYPIIAVIIAVLVGLGIYHYQLDQQEQAEEKVSTALDAAKTPADIVKAADAYPDTVQASVGLMRAAALSSADKDYDSAQKDYQRVIDAKQAPDELRDSAQLGLAIGFLHGGEADDAIHSYMEVAQKGNRSPFAPVAYHQVAAIYASRQDKANEEKTLQLALRLGGDSPFVKEAADRLKILAPPRPFRAVSVRRRPC